MRNPGTYYQCRRPQEDKPCRSDPQFVPERLSNIRLKNKLCSMGPGGCARCRGCLYGLEWVRRHPEGGGKK